MQAKQPELDDHSSEVADLAVRVARQLGLAGEQLDEVARAAELHDVGKVGIPEHILGKHGDLSSEEWAVMRTHPVVGAEIVAPIAFLSGAVGLIRHHHERFDGSGYPDALRGEEIPLAARVFAVADSFDAMTSDRPYRRAMGIERALAEIRAGAGTQWDPDVARVFVQMIEEDPPTDDEAFARALGQAG